MWEKNHSEEYSSGTVMCSQERESQATLRFVGSEVRWIGTRGPDRGMASTFIDGVFQATVDQYSSDRQVLQELFSMNGLSHGPHSITVKVDGARNEKSSGVRIDIDAFDVGQ